MVTDRCLVRAGGRERPGVGAGSGHQSAGELWSGDTPRHGSHPHLCSDAVNQGNCTIHTRACKVVIHTQLVSTEWAYPPVTPAVSLVTVVTVLI